MTIGLGTKIATTLQFPKKITGLVGYGLTDGSAPGTYHYSHPAGSRVLSLRCLAPDKEAYISVMLSDAIYPLHLKATTNPFVVVRLVEKHQPRAAAPKAKSISKEEIKERRLDYSAERLLAFLKMSKNERTLRKSLPELYKGMQHRKVDLRYDDGKVSTLIREVYRFPKDDTFTFLVEIENRMEHPIAYDPGSMQIKVGKRMYPVNVADASGFVPAKSKARAHLLLRGDTEGARANLSIKNDFRLVMAAYGPYEEPPDSLTEYWEPGGDPFGEGPFPAGNMQGPDSGLLPPLEPERRRSK